VIDHVIDASVAVELFVRDARPDPALRRRVLTGTAAAPELLDLEVCSVVRRMVLRGEVRPENGREALLHVRDAPVLRVGHRQLVERIWELRGAVTAYDGAYVALAEELEVPLLTCDARLGRANGHRADIVVYPRS
jgi:predicted nucleic acid-binding protein